MSCSDGLGHSMLINTSTNYLIYRMQGKLKTKPFCEISVSTVKKAEECQTKNKSVQHRKNGYGIWVWNMEYDFRACELDM